MSFLFLLDCNGVCQKCDEAKTELGGYCLCYPNGYYSAGVHVEKRGVCILPPGEDATSIPRMDDVQPDHIKKPKKLHAEDGTVAAEQKSDDTVAAEVATLLGEIDDLLNNDVLANAKEYIAALEKQVKACTTAHGVWRDGVCVVKKD